MRVIFDKNGGANRLEDTTDIHVLDYNGDIAIKIRGNTSAYLPKKPYAIHTTHAYGENNNVGLLGLPPENDWVLNNIAYEPSYVRDYISYGLSEKIGQYAPRCRYCEVFVNGDYRGLYILTEKMKADKNRIDIAEEDESEISGGYIFKADRDELHWQDYAYHGDSVVYTINFPIAENLSQEQVDYIHSYYFDFTELANTQNQAIDVGFPSKIDIPSFVDYMIIGEFSSNADVYQLSTYFHKDKQGKLRAGPVWDFNLTFGNDLTPTPYYNRSKYNVWQFSNRNNEGAKFWTDLFNNPTFRCYFSRRWHELTAEGQALEYENVCNMIDETEETLGDAIVRDCYRWGYTDHHLSNIDSMKTWISKRIEWINNNIGQYDECQEIELPNIVISKINYNPKPYSTFSSNNLEFIELANNSDEEINLTGIYFSGLGLGYVFPTNSTLAARKRIILCSDSTTFKKHYHETPFGQYARHLSNQSQKLTLADAWGNIIDLVEYSSEYPWPIEANCRGSFLQLDDLNSDNNLAENWTVANSLAIDETKLSNIAIHPNPFHESTWLTTQADGLKELHVYNTLGHEIRTENSDDKTITINLKDQPYGIYFIKIISGNDTWTGKLIKE